jgi:hypothetical protein
VRREFIVAAVVFAAYRVEVDFDAKERAFY